MSAVRATDRAALDQCCTFRSGGLWFGLSVADVQEVLRALEMTPVPCAPPAVRGLLNLRGEIVTAIDLAHRLGLADEDGPQGGADGTGDTDGRMNVVVRSRGEVVSLLVDDIGEVIDTAGHVPQPPPPTLPPALREVVTGVLPLPDGLLLLLDADRTADVTPAPTPHPPVEGTP